MLYVAKTFSHRSDFIIWELGTSRVQNPTIRGPGRWIQCLGTWSSLNGRSDSGHWCTIHSTLHLLKKSRWNYQVHHVVTIALGLACTPVVMLGPGTPPYRMGIGNWHLDLSPFFLPYQGKINSWEISILETYEKNDDLSGQHIFKYTYIYSLLRNNP